ncbi:MAG: hypothetical protein CMP38_04970 [Rickettsiales bacterium]|nr:hypothetical protein [Rickettsiales bacterium]OUW02615.1 MAG: hypothetical protein CBD16_04055 [Betaproteobacteria bacterium TMED156]
MKKLLLLTLLCFSINGFAFNWKKIGEDESFSVYIDVDNINERNGLVYYWSLHDTPSITSSTIFKSKVDCIEERVVVTTLTIYNQPMGKGEISLSLVPDAFHYPQPNTSMYLEMKFACANAK